MFKVMLALAIAGTMNVPVAAQTVSQTPTDAVHAQAEAQAQPAEPQMVKKCRRVPDYASSGTMLGPTHQECKMVPAKGNRSANRQQGGEAGAGGKK